MSGPELQRGVRGAEPPARSEAPRLPTFTLLVGRITTIKLAYWTALTAAEVAVGLTDRPFDERVRISIAVAAALTVVACAWAAWSARAVDRRAGTIERSIPTIATTFIAASAVATPASLPLLFVEIHRAGEACPRGICHWEAVWYWIAAIAIGTLVIPLVFALRMRGASAVRS